MPLVDPQAFDAKRARQLKDRVKHRTVILFNLDILKTFLRLKDVTKISDIKTLLRGHQKPGFRGLKFGQIGDVDVFGDEKCINTKAVK